MGYLTTDKKKITSKTFIQLKQAGEKITMLTAYDYTTASLLDAAGIDGLLVGDSASNVMAGNDDTLPITVDEMIIYARSVVRGCHHCLVICDMPFGSYQVSEEKGVRNAVRIMKETGVDALKIEGGAEIAPLIKHLTSIGIPVMGHLGLTPQSIHQFGGYGLRAKDETEAQKLLADAKALEEAGCFGITLEKIPSSLAEQVTNMLSIPTIGIGAGVHTDGQILVYADAMGMTQGFKPKFLRRFAEVGEALTKGVADYCKAVKEQTFPSSEESY